MLVSERDQWRVRFNRGDLPVSKVLSDYREHRDSESWRATRLTEELCEYILYLESKVNDETGV